MIGLFDDVNLLKKQHNEKTQFLNDFYSSSKIWRNELYLTTKLLPNQKTTFEEGAAILVKRTKIMITKFVDSGEYSKEMLRNCLLIIIKENKIISEDNIRKTKDFIDLGFYNEELNIIEEELELESIAEDDFWEEFLI